MTLLLTLWLNVNILWVLFLSKLLEIKSCAVLINMCQHVCILVAT